MLVNTLIQRCEVSFAIFQHVKQAAMPRFTGIEVDFEAEPAIGVNRLGVPSPGGNRYGTDKLAVAIGCPKFLLRL